MLLGGHAPAYADDEVGVLCADVLVLADDGQRFFLGMLADGAGVDHNEVGLVRLGNDLVAHFLGHTRDLLAVGLVLLASEGEDEAPAALPRLTGVGLVPRPYPGGVVLALGKADGREYILCCHVGSFAKNSLLYIIPHFFENVKTRGAGRRKNALSDGKKICKKRQENALSPFISDGFCGIMK